MDTDQKILVFVFAIIAVLVFAGIGWHLASLPLEGASMYEDALKIHDGSCRGQACQD